MERFKLRIWDKRIKKMVTSENSQEFHKEIEEYGKQKGLSSYDTEREFIQYEPDEWYPVCSFSMLAWYEDFKKECFVIMQCTGLLDKNGKLIYEGDLVELYYNNVKMYESVVKWDKEQAMFYIEDPKSGEIDRIGDYNLNLNIIGNIYEQEQPQSTDAS